MFYGASAGSKLFAKVIKFPNLPLAGEEIFKKGADFLCVYFCFLEKTLIVIVVQFRNIFCLLLICKIEESVIQWFLFYK